MEATMRIEQLQQIIEIKKQRSISKAAKSLFISQPTLSNSLSSLEQEIQVTIFERTHSGVRLTPEGEDILNLAENALGDIDRIRYYNCEKREYTGEVRVLHTPAYGFITYKLVRALKTLYPKVTLTLDQRPLEDLLKAMQEGVAYIGILTWGLFPEQTEQALKDRGLAFQRMNQRTLKAYVGAENPLAQRDELCVGDLKSQSFVSYSSAFWQRLEESMEMPHDEALILMDTDDIKKSVYKGHQIALLPDLFAIDDVYCEQGLIQLKSIDGQASMAGYDCIVSPANKALSALEKDVIRLIQSMLTEQNTPCSAKHK